MTSFFASFVPTGWFTPGSPPPPPPAQQQQPSGPLQPASPAAGQQQQPTRSHWVPDAQAPFCTAPGCAQPFGLLERRHHCRRCGDAVCQTHFNHTLRLDVKAVPVAVGVAVAGASWECNVCDECYLQHQRRRLLQDALEQQQAQTGDPQQQQQQQQQQHEVVFYSMPPVPLSDNVPLLLPDIVYPFPNQEVYLGSVLQHLHDLAGYVNGVRNALVQTRDSMVRREHMQTEKADFQRAVRDLQEHEATLRGVVNPASNVGPHVKGYVALCIGLIEDVLAWAQSTDVFLLLSGMATLKSHPGELPEEDFAKVEARIQRNEAHVEKLLATLFDIPAAEQQDALQRLRFFRARLQHDLDEYEHIPGPEMQSFQGRLSNSIQYIDMHMEMCTGNMQLLDMQTSLANHEAVFFVLLTDCEVQKHQF